MLRRVEDKAGTKPGQEDVFTAMSGKMYRRADVENPSRPGFLRDELVPILPDHWAAGSYFDLFTPTHRRMRPLPARPDPNIVTAAHASAPLREAVSATERELEEAQRRVGEALERLAALERRRAKAIAAQDKNGYNQTVAEEPELRQAITEAEAGCSLPRVRLCRAQEALHDWIRLEANTRAAGQQTAPAAIF